MTNPVLLGLPEYGRCAVFAILNITPDSFSDGGASFAAEDAIGHGLAALAAGVDVLDVGGESTRPGAEPVSEADEMARVVPLIRKLAAEVEVPISIDNLKPGGVFIVLDHAAAPGTAPDPQDRLHRIDPALVRKEVEAVGFKFEGESNVLRNPQDDHTKAVFDPSIRGKTDQFIYKFRKPK